MSLPIYLREAAAAFKEGAYATCISLCERLRSDRPDDHWPLYMLAYASHRRGDPLAAQAQLREALRLKPDEQRLHQLQQEIEADAELAAAVPQDFLSGAWCEGKTVLKVGGAVSPLFEKQLARAKRVINVNAAAATLGQGNAVDILADAHALPALEAASVDAVASSHTIEHLVNPLLALREWKRVLRPGGFIYSCVPDYRKTFDHKRELTTLRHLVEDLESGKVSMDWFHAEEFLRRYDVSRDFVFQDDPKRHFAEYIKAPQLMTHFHVFDRSLVYVMHEYAGFATLACFESDISIHYFGRLPG